MIRTSGVSQSEAGRIIETSQSRIATLISGGGVISPGDLTMLAQGLGFTDPGYLEALRELRRDNHKRGSWSTGHNRAYRDDLRLLVDLETYADRVRRVEVEVVPALLQTESYIRSQHADQPPLDGVSMEDTVQARLARQHILDRDDPPVLHAILSESCVRRQWGDAEVMAEQRAHLVEVSNRPNIMIQLVPFDAPPGRRSPLGSQFTLLRVQSPGAAGPLEIVTSENPGEIRYMDDQKALDAHDSAWARLSSAALSFADTRTFIQRISA
ncbi:DNA-binding protein [Pseudonocardia sp. HH130630-07]|nr:DNA-binding protein [Pseudonocardia sp. HH130630-07]